MVGARRTSDTAGSPGTRRSIRPGRPPGPGVPEETLFHFANHGEVGGILPRDGGRASETLSAICNAGVDLGALAADLQSEGTETFDESWSGLLKAIEANPRH